MELLLDKDVDTVHVVGNHRYLCVQYGCGADAYGFQTKVHNGVATFTDLGDTMLEHMTRCFHTEIIK